MRLALALVLILLSKVVFSQQNCFDQCWTRIEQSGKTFPLDVADLAERNSRILQGLIGCKAPELAVKTIDGRELSLSAYRGKVVVLDFWFTTCEPCLYELPGLNRLVKEYSDKAVHFVALARSSQDEVTRFLSKHEFAFSQALSTEELHKTFCLLGGWPMNMVIDGEGILRHVRSGGPVPPDGNPLQPYLDMKPVLDRYIPK